ncbi:hypothetical protein [Desulfonatronum parangueonense]
MDRNPGTGDRIFHVVPPPEREQPHAVIFGPMWISPEVVLPVPGCPGDLRKKQGGLKHPEVHGKPNQ